jgi:hypothetical protein
MDIAALASSAPVLGTARHIHERDDGAQAESAGISVADARSVDQCILRRGDFGVMGTPL